LSFIYLLRDNGHKVQGKTYTFWWALGSAALMAIGSFGAWVTFLGFSRGGIEGGDGWFVLAAAAIGAGLVLWHNNTPAVWKLGLVAVAGLVAVGVAIYDWTEIESIASESDNEFTAALAEAVSPGWGLILSVLASASLVGSMIVHYFKFVGGRFERSAEAPPTDTISEG
jgi:hypothetical protein